MEYRIDRWRTARLLGCVVQNQTQRRYVWIRYTVTLSLGLGMVRLFKDNEGIVNTGAKYEHVDRNR